MFILSVEKLPQKYENDIWEIVVASDEEFVPCLSSRETTTQKNLAQGESDAFGKFEPNALVKPLPIKYFEIMKEQNFILAIENHRVLGFLSYIENFLIDTINDGMPCDYTSTVIVSRENRGKGITKRLYKALLETSGGNSLVTRTWSTNFAHINILRRLEFDLVHRIENDRGQGIDTVYFQKLL